MKMQFLIAAILLGVVSSLNNDGRALMTIKDSFRNRLLDWDDVHNFCSWRGVFCDSVTFSVVSLNLSTLNLRGEISPAIGDLRNLRSINLVGNNLTGQIPDEIGNCASLVYLDLSDNLLNGDIPFSITKLKHLETLYLGNNQLTGPVPSTLTQIPNLQILGLNGNLLTGTLSFDMCQLSGLWYFDVRGNNLTGTIPESIGNCTSFQFLDISDNQITGEIPYNIGFLQVLSLSLQGNKLTGRIPEVIGLMQTLAVLDLSDNELVGSIPAILGNLSFTTKLYLHGNKLHGPIPSELGNMSSLNYLQLNDNKLVGTVPSELGKLEQLFILNLANNRLEGPLPSNISSCAALIQLNVHGNLMSGSIAPTFRNLGTLTNLNLSSNYFIGKIPAELGHIINLDRLDLSSNNLSGSIPLTFGDLEHLLILNLSRNHIRGQLLAEFGNLSSIQMIDVSFNLLSGVIPSELGQLQDIISLILNNNKLHGKIPDQLTNSTTLVNLNVSFNNYFRDNSTDEKLLKVSSIQLCRKSISLRRHGWTYVQSCTKISRSVVICIIFGVVTLSFVIFIAIYKSKQQKKTLRGPSEHPEGSTKLVILHMGMGNYTFDDIMRTTENLSEKYIIGNGASSTVYKCALQTSRPIAIKRLHNEYLDNLREFETELETIGSIRHRNVASLHGYALSPFGNLLFYDYMEKGSLWDLLHGSSNIVKLDWETRLKIAVGAAHGLAYLHHDCVPRIVHRDIKSTNILVDENFEGRISDFGIAKSITDSKTHAFTYVMGTIGYVDPEYAHTFRLNEKSDIYSFGIVLLELVTGKKAVDNETNLHQLIMSKADDSTEMEEVDPEVTSTCADLGPIRKTFQLALNCTKRNPIERPTMIEVSRVLLSLLRRRG